VIKFTHGIVLLTVVCCLGCGTGDQMETAKVTGKVTFDGQPVTGGQLLFAPNASGDEPGKAGAAQIQSDGTFTVSTYGDGDGAVIGTHTVSYTAPPPKTSGGDAAVGSSSGTPTEKAGKPEPSPFAGLAPEQKSVEIVDGMNELEIKLVKP